MKIERSDMKGARVFRSRKVVPVLLAMLLLGAGFGAGYLAGASGEDDSKSGVSSAAESQTYRDKLLKLAASDASLTAQAIDAQFKNSSGANDSKKAVYENANELAAAFSETLGGTTGQEFSKEWKVYLDQLFIYAAAAKKKDEAAKGSAKTKIAASSSAIAGTLSQSIPDSDIAIVRTGLEAYTSNNMQAIDSLANGSPAEKTEALQAADQQAKTLFSYIADKMAKR